MISIPLAWGICCSVALGQLPNRSVLLVKSRGVRDRQLRPRTPTAEPTAAVLARSVLCKRRPTCAWSMLRRPGRPWLLHLPPGPGPADGRVVPVPQHRPPPGPPLDHSAERGVFRDLRQHPSEISATRQRRSNQAKPGWTTIQRRSPTSTTYLRGPSAGPGSPRCGLQTNPQEVEPTGCEHATATNAWRCWALPLASGHGGA